MNEKNVFTLITILVGIVGAIYIAKFLMFVIAPITGVVLLLIFIMIVLGLENK